MADTKEVALIRKINHLQCYAFIPIKHTCSMIAKKGRDVASIDLPVFFLQTKKEEPTLLKLTGVLALLL